MQDYAALNALSECTVYWLTELHYHLIVVSVSLVDTFSNVSFIISLRIKLLIIICVHLRRFVSHFQYVLSQLS